MLDAYNIGIYKGTSYKATVQWKDDITNAYVSLVGASVVLQARYYYQGPVVIESSTTNGRITLDDPSHNITITISPAQTITVPVNGAPLLYDVLLKLADGTIYKILEGSLLVLPSVSTIA